MQGEGQPEKLTRRRICRSGEQQDQGIAGRANVQRIEVSILQIAGDLHVLRGVAVEQRGLPPCERVKDEREREDQRVRKSA